MRMSYVQRTELILISVKDELVFFEMTTIWVVYVLKIYTM